MQYGLRTLLGILVLGCAGLAMAGPWSYPPAPTSDAADVWFGKRYLYPYRPLENTKDKTVEAWFRAQAALSDRTLARISGRDALIREWSAIDKRTPPSYRGVVVENGRTFYRKTVGGENVGKIYMRERWDGPERLLFDPASQGKGGDTVVTSFTPSWDGSLLMLTLTAKGSEWGACAAGGRPHAVARFDLAGLGRGRVAARRLGHSLQRRQRHRRQESRDRTQSPASAAQARHARRQRP